jgi:hypothetical protein
VALTAGVRPQFVDEGGDKLTELFSLRNPRLRPASKLAHGTLAEYQVRLRAGHALVVGGRATPKRARRLARGGVAAARTASAVTHAPSTRCRASHLVV